MTMFTKTNSWFQKLHKEFGQPQTSNGKPKIQWATFVQKNTLLQLKHIQKIYLTLLSTTCVKIHEIRHVTF